MTDYDVIVVGAGPAGAQCARQLVHVGHRVLLLEKSPNFEVQNFSSACSPQQILQQFVLPESVVEAHWDTFEVHSSKLQAVWQGDPLKGVVFSFKKLREYLANHATKLAMGSAYKSHQSSGADLVVSYGESQSACRLLVDATGSDRAVLQPGQTQPNKMLEATGLEYLVEVDEQTYARASNRISFFCGQGWMPQGYSWIFPMGPNCLKVGAARYYCYDKLMPYESSFVPYIEKLMADRLGKADWPVLEKHGKRLSYCYGRRDPHVQGAVLAIGDAVSTLNPLGGEGIRHGMQSANFAATRIHEYLLGNESSLLKYPKDLRAYTRFSWWAVEKVIPFLYSQPRDERVDAFVRALQPFSASQMKAFVFDYDWKAILRFALRYAPLWSAAALDAAFSASRP